jgi:hypothetical protein
VKKQTEINFTKAALLEGVVKLSSEERDGAKKESREKGRNVFEVSSGERTPFFNLEEGVFNDMPFFVDALVVEALKIPVALGRD